MYSEAGGNGCRAAPATLITLYNIFDGSFCFSGSHKSNSRYNPDPETPVFYACGFSHKSSVVSRIFLTIIKFAYITCILNHIYICV